MKKVLSLVLVIAMVLSSFSFAFAASFEDVVDTDYEKAIKTLVGLGVVTGYEDGTYRPERIVTRAEMAKLIVEILGYGDLVAGSASNFADTQGHWADSWIALAAGRGLVVGTGDGNFTPDRQVSYDEAITMIVRALGYTDDCNELKGMTWPTNFKVKAADLKLTKDVKIVGTGADRGGVAQLLFNALEANMVIVDSDGNVNYVKDGDDNKILLNALAAKNQFVVNKNHLDKDHRDYKGDIVDLAPYMYQDIKVFENDDDEVVYVTKVESEVKIGEFRHAKNDDGVNVRIDGKNKLTLLANATSTAVYYNGVETTLSEAEMENGSATVVDLHKAAATFVLNDDDEITAIIAEKYTDVKKVANEYNGRSRFEGFNLPLDDDDDVDYDKLTVKGVVDSLEEIEEEDVIVLYAGGGLKNITGTTEPEKLVIEVVRDVVEGRITAKNSDGEYSIDGKYYPVNPLVDDIFEVGNEGVFYLDNKGHLVDFEDEATTAGNYAVVTEILHGVYEGDPVNRMILKPQISLVTTNGEEITYNVKSTAKFKATPDGAEANLILGANDTDINDDLDMYSVVRYTINNSNEITRITVQGPNNTGELPSIKTDSKGFVLANNVVIFAKDGTDVDVVTENDLGDEIDVLFEKVNKNGQYEVLFVDGLGESDTYAYIIDSGSMLNKDDDIVQSITAYVDGVKVVYEVEYGYTVTSSSIDSANIVKLNFDGSIIESVDSPVADGDDEKLIADNSVVTRVTGNRIQIDGAVWYTLDDDVAVYILDGGKFDDVGEASSVYTSAKVAGYAFDEDNQKANVIEVLFIFE